MFKALFALLAGICLAASVKAQGNMTITPPVLTFQYQLGSATLPAAETLQVESSPIGLNFSVAISGSPFNAAWLLVSASAGKSPTSLKVQVNPTGLPAGTYIGTITLTGMAGSMTVTQSARVTLEVADAAPSISTTPASLTFSYVTGAPIPSPSLSSAFVLSSSGAALPATVSITNASWLKVTPTGNITLIGLLNTISVAVDPTGLAPKIYTGQISITAPGAVNKSLAMTVTLTVNSATPVASATWPIGAIQGSGQTIVTVDGSSFFSNSTVDASGFTPASTITATDGTNTANMTFLIPVYQPTDTVLRLAIGSPLPDAIVGTAYSQPLAAAGGTSPYTYSAISGLMPPGLAVGAGAVSGTPSAAGTYLFTIQVTDSSVPAINAYQQVQLTVDPAAATALRITSASAPLPDASAGVAYGPVTLNAAGGTGGPYTWSAANLPTGLALSANGVLSGIPSTDGSTGALAPNVVSSGAMLVTLPTSQLAVPGVLRMTVTTPPPGGGTSNEAQFQIFGAGPQITAVVNSASFVQGTLAVGDLITIFGLGLGPASLTVFNPGTPPIPFSLPSSAPSTSVTINGIDAPVLYTSATQVGVIVPYALAGATAQVVVSYGGLASQAFVVAIASTDPGVYSVAASGSGQGAILNYNATTQDYTINSNVNPAPRGSTIVIYLTGGGATTSAVDNQLIPLSPPVTPLAVPSVTIGGQGAVVLAAQEPPGSVPGLLQLNVTVPATVAPNPALPVVVSMAGASSQTGLTMAVK